MSKLNTLKTQNPDLDISLIDALGLVYKTKYVEMYLNIYKTKKSKEDNNNEDDMTSFQIEMIDMGFNEKYVIDLSKKLSHIQQHFVSELISGINYRDIRSFNKFIELNERGLIDNKDVTSYKSMEDVLSQISIAELKLIDKELEKLVLKLHEDEEWLIIKPLTYESSCKYGAGTKWCTAATSEEYQYHNYTRRGILTYAMNRKTGVKVAAFKNLDSDHQRETSFWNAIDERLDSSECGLPLHILDIIITDFRSCIKSNYDLGTDEIKEMNDERLNGKEKHNLSYSLRELADRYNLTVAEQPVEEAVPSIEYELTTFGA